MNWFNSSYYHILYKNRDYNEAEHFINNLITKLNIKKNSKILDLACGSGRHSIYLNKKGMNVKGYDNSENNIIKAKKFENSRLSFQLKEMSEKYDDNFDYIFNLFTSFGYNSKKHNYKTLKSIEESLNGDGILVIDFLNINKVESELINQEIKTINNITFKIKREINNGFIIKNINVIDGEKNYNFKETVMSLNLNDFKGYFNDFKLKIISTYGDYNLNPFNKKSERLIMVIKKSQP